MSTENNSLEIVSQLPAEQFSAFGSMTQFETAQRMALALCSSSIVPETYRGKERIGDCLIALEIANRIGATVLAVMQNLYIVHGRPAWSSQFLISCINASRKFSPLRYQMTGEKNTDSWGCIAWAEDKSGERLESPEITIAMAKAEGWYSRNGSKWKTLPELMLRYRTATLFARLYAPELTMGIQTDDEVIDISPVVTEPTKPAKRGVAKHEFEQAGPEPSKPEPVKEATKAPEQPRQEQPSSQPAKQESLIDDQPEADSPQAQLGRFMSDAGVSFDKFRRWAEETERLENADSFASFADLPTAFCEALKTDARTLTRCINRCKSY